MFHGIKFIYASLLLALAINLETVQADGITVAIYKHANFGGASREIFVEDNKCFPFFGEWVDDISSIRLSNNCVQIYDGGNCDGKSEVLDGNRPNSAALTFAKNLGAVNFNDKVRSLRRC